MGIRRAIGAFCAEIAQDQYAPQQKWIRDVVTGMSISGSVMLSEIGRALDEETEDGSPRELNHTEKRLSRNLNSDRLDDEALATRHLEAVSRFTKKNDGEGVVIAVDYTDLAKRRANPDPDRGMEGVCVCWNGSDKETSLGYPVVQAEAHLPDGNQLPLVLHPFTYEEPGITKGSQIKIFLDQIAKAAPYVGPRAWWAFDRGFDNTRLFHGMDAMKLRWIVRLQAAVPNERSVFTADGRLLKINDAALEVIPRYKTEIPAGRGRKKHTGKKMLALEIGSRKVFLTDQKNTAHPMGPARTLIVVYGFGNKPIVMLTSELLEGRAAVLEAFKVYGRRWKAEEATRSMKDSRHWGVRLEDVRALTLRGVRRLVRLAAILYTFLATLRETGGSILDRVTRAVSFFREAPDPRYRLLRGLGALLARFLKREEDPYPDTT